MLRYQHMQVFKELMIRKMFRCNVELIRSESHNYHNRAIDQFVPRARVGRSVNRIIAITSGMCAKEISKAFSLTRPSPFGARARNVD